MSDKMKLSKLPSLDSKDKASLTHYEPSKIILTAKTPRLLTKFAAYTECKSGQLKINQVEAKGGKEQEIRADVQDKARHKSQIISHDHVKFVSHNVMLETFEKRIVSPLQHEALFAADFNPTHEDIRIAKLQMLEDQEHQLLNNPRFGLNAIMSKGYTISVDKRRSEPCSDYLDEGLSLVWQNPSHTAFVCNPMTKSAMQKEIIKDGTLMPIVMRSGHSCPAYVGVPIIQSSHVPLRKGKDGKIYSDIWVVRTSSSDQAGYTRLGATPEDSARLGDVHIQELTINDSGQREHHLAHYTSAVALSTDCIARIKDVLVNSRPNVR